jgi:adenylylsulfate kinase
MTQTPSAGFTLWLTGMPASGKSTIANGVVSALVQQKVPCELLDGDVVRTNLSKGLGFSRDDRDTNVLRVGFVCSLLNKYGINAVVALISPYQSTRDQLRTSLPHFIEAYVECPLEVCIQRDPKGLYKKALSGEIPEFTGVSSPYEAPEKAELLLKTHEETVEKSVEKIINYLRSKEFI